MTHSVPQLAIEVVWFDDDMLELSLTVCNDRFSGQTKFYAARDEPAKFAEQIAGFPRAVDDTRKHEFGGIDLPGCGGARVRLSCKDGSGHLLVQVTVHETSGGPSPRVTQSATVELDSVPAAIDSFVEELRRMRAQVGAVALLHRA